MKILVTGSSGFIASRLIEKLKGHTVISFDIQTGQDLMNFEQIEEAIKKVDVIYHLAAQADFTQMIDKPYEGTVLNIDATHNVANLCAKHKKWLIYISTICVYGNQKTEPTTEKSLPNPSELYAETKLAGECIVKGYGSNFGMDWTILRIATIYGERMREALGMHIFFTQAISGKDITVHGDGEQVRTLTYIDDVVNGMIAVINSKKSKKETFIISNKQGITANKMAEDIKELTCSSSKIVHILQRPNQTFKENFDVSKAKELLNWETKTSWKEGLNNTYKFLTKKL